MNKNIEDSDDNIEESKNQQLDSISEELDMMEVEERLEMLHISSLTTDGCCGGNSGCNGSCSVDDEPGDTKSTDIGRS